jgi:hypothetical protein
MGSAPAIGDDSRTFRLGATARMYSDANLTDVRAAMKAWVTALARDGNIPLEPDWRVFPNVGGLRKFGRNHPVGGYGVTLPEYDGREVDFDLAIFGVSGGRVELGTIGRLEKTSGGRQILALLRPDRAEVHSVSRLEESLALMERHRRLSRRAAADETAGTP